MGKKVYGIKEGYDFKNNKKIENVIVHSWNECLKYVNGVKGAKYKSFESMENAKEYLNQKSKLLKKGQDEYPLDQLHIYVDGSYNVETEKYSYAVVAVKNGVIIHIENAVAEDSSKKSIRQIGGELTGAIKAVKYAAINNQKEFVLFHDYEGICYHATGVWECRDDSSKEYNKEINDIIKTNNIKVTFVKVDSHTGDLFNEVADEEAKIAAGLDTNNVVEKWLKNNCINVISDEVKNKLLEIVSNANEDKIFIVDKCNNDELVNESNEITYIIKNIKSLKDSKQKEKYINDLDDEIKTKIILKLIKENYKK